MDANQEIKADKYAGCMLGLLLGDALGAPHEGGPIERMLWRLIGHTKNGKRRYTDDSQMSIDVATSILHHPELSQNNLAQRFAGSYRWSRGYGKSAAWLLKQIKHGQHWSELNKAKFPEGSLGNGAAMRAAVVALAWPHSVSEIEKNSIRIAEITHAHPLAIEGAKLIALATHAALHDRPNEEILAFLANATSVPAYQARLAFCRRAVLQDKLLWKHEIIAELGNKMSALESSVTAIYFALRFRQQTLLDMLNAIAKLGGDVDTIGAMAGAIWGACNGANKLPQDYINSVEDNELVRSIALRLYTARWK